MLLPTADVTLATPPPTKKSAVRARLLRLARERGPGARLPGVRDLCADFGVSLATVNGALDELEGERIVQRRHGSGIFVTADAFRPTVALICRPSFFCSVGASPFWAILVRAAQSRADSLGERLLFHFTHESFVGETETSPVPSLAPDLADQMVSGTIQGVLGVGLNEATSAWIERQNVPFAAFAGPGKRIVVLPPSGSTRKGVDYLARIGCRKIALCAGQFGSSGNVTRERQAFVDELALRSLAVHDALLPHVEASAEPPSLHEQGYAAAHRLFSGARETWPDGIVSSDDMVTSGLLAGMRRVGVEPERDVKIVTHANAGSPTLLGWEDRLARVEVDPAEIVRALFDLLDDAIADAVAARVTDTERVLAVALTLIPPEPLRPPHGSLVQNSPAQNPPAGVGPT